MSLYWRALIFFFEVTLIKNEKVVRSSERITLRFINAFGDGGGAGFEKECACAV